MVKSLYGLKFLKMKGGDFMKKITFVTLVVVLVCLIVSSAQAFNVQLFKPTTAQTEGLQVYTSDSLQKYELAIGFSTNYNHNPLEVGLATCSRCL